MKLCKKFTDAESKCGKNLCCQFCDDFDTCSFKCDVMDKGCEYMMGESSEERSETTQIEAQNAELTKFQPIIDALYTIEKTVSDLKEKQEEYKEQLKVAMEKFQIKSWDAGKLIFSYVAPSTRETIDSTKLKKDHPDIVEAYKKISEVKSSIRVKLK